MGQHTEPDETTRNVDGAGVGDDHSADRPGTEEEDAAADEHYAKGDPAGRAGVARHEKEMMEIGAEAQGEGAID